ncbi:MAG: molybdopterin molybdotransferase MoeA [Pirellulales bacterium]|nr:molybdopterin molybdotransferase MoeA [Pirellulales bacterium]
MPHPAVQPAVADVRMRGFTTRATVDAAIAWIDSTLLPVHELPAETVSLLQAAGRVLASNVVSPVDVPGFPRAMMDGYAVVAGDTRGASVQTPLPLAVLGTCLPSAAFAQAVSAGNCVKIMTGAPLPTGANAVLPVEQTRLEGDRMLAMGQVAPGKHVGKPGEDVHAGDLVAQLGRVLRPQDIGLLSSLGLNELTVVRRPRARILITGNELLPMGTPPTGTRITDSNGPMLAALVARDGGEPISGPIVPDDRDAILAAMRDDADIVLVSGGSSVGQEDHAPTLLAQHGELAIHGIAMRPAGPAGMGKLDGRWVFLLPGNPVSCLCAYDFFAGRAIRALAGRPRKWPYECVRLPLASKLASVVGRVDYARVAIRNHTVEPIAMSGGSALSSATKADGFVVIPMDTESYPAGTEVEVCLFG